MSTILIGTDLRPLEDADPHWVTQEINERRKDGQAVCIRVTIKTDDLDFNLSTPTCGAGSAGGRPPSSRERPILDLWTELRLSSTSFSPGDVVAFVQRVRKYL
jgi:hypothetical protein